MDAPAPMDLEAPIAAGRSSLLGCLDPTARHMPYWSIPADPDTGVGAFSHAGAWDWCHDVARALHALDMAAQATGDPVPEAVWADLSQLQLELFADDDLPGCPHDQTGERFVNLHNVREAAHALAAMIRRGSADAERLARGMVRRVLGALDSDGVIDLDRLPTHLDTYTWQPHQEGRAVDALVRLFRVTGDEAALDLAARMTRFALATCFGPVGELREEAGSHGHSINALVAGMLDLAAATCDSEVADAARAAYEVALPRFNASFGWSLEALQRPNLRGESNNTGDLVRAALLVGAGGRSRGYEDAERYLRSHLLPSQVLEVGDLPDAEDGGSDALSRRASRLRGGFSFPTPNDLLVEERAALVTYDITSGAVDGLCEARRAAITPGPDAARVNLLFSGRAHGVEVRSELPESGRVAVAGPGDRPVMVRVPSWVQEGEARWEVGDREVAATRLGGYSLAPLPPGSPEAVLTFPVPARRTTEWVSFQEFTIDWIGDCVVAMSPAATLRPMFPAVSPKGVEQM